MFRFLSILTVLMVVSCTEKPVEVPLDQEQLIPLLIDLHTAEMMINSASKQDKDSLRIKLIDDVLTLNQIDSAILSQTLQALAANPHKYFEISQIVADSTQAMKKQYLDEN